MFDSSIVEALTLSISKDINNKKIELVNKRLKIAGFDEIDFEKEKTKKFKKIAVVTESGSSVEKWFYNDGSENGFLIITFFQTEPSFDYSNLDSIKYNTNINYI